MPFFSIIIPVYNVAPFLCECLDSVLAQRFASWEAICVDDGSVDNSGTILDEYAEKDSRFRVIHQHNVGVGAARNKGLEVATGKWVLFLDADDVWNTNLLSTMADIIAAHPHGRLFRFGSEKFGDGKWAESVSERKCECHEIDISKEITMHDFCHYYFYCYVYSRELLAGIRFPRYVRGEDWCFLNRVMLERGDAIWATEGVLHGYRVRAGSAVNSIPSLQVLCDEMDHRLDVMGMIDAGPKKVEYKGDYWLEGYFTNTLPVIMLDRQSDFELIKEAWRERLPRLCVLKGLSLKGRLLLRLSLSRLFRSVGDFLIFTIPYLRYRSPILKPVARLYRRARHHGEFAEK